MPNLKISIQGDQASFHDIAAADIFPKSSRIFCETFSDTFKALSENKADYAVCAIENSLYGSINEVYDLLIEYDFKIIGEVYLRIEQCLIGLPGSNIGDINKIYSHPVALAQCSSYLNSELETAEREEYHDTAAAVKLIKDIGNLNLAAIASRKSAELYGMEILAESIETNKDNFTRFVALSKSENKHTDINKLSLVITTDHSPGSLYRALGVFETYSLNLTKLQSRPIIGKAWHYMFYIDADLEKYKSFIPKLASNLIKEGCEVKVLGVYKKGSTLNANK